jgi:D-alanyl-D-alanine dipeptidase
MRIYTRLLPLFIGLGLITSCATTKITTMGDESRKQDLANLPESANPVLARAGLIAIQEVDDSVKVDLQYKKPTAIARSPLYEPSFHALLRPETAVRLKHANAYVKKHGMRIVVWDAYRPPSAQVQLWNASGQNDTFVANPHNVPSRHSCGTAIDVTLVGQNGEPEKMPTGFDAFTPDAASDYFNPDPEIRRNLKILKFAMKKAGFLSLHSEWWHYIDKNYRKYPDTIPLEKLDGSY